MAPIGKPPSEPRMTAYEHCSSIPKSHDIGLPSVLDIHSAMPDVRIILTSTIKGKSDGISPTAHTLSALLTDSAASVGDFKK